MLTNPARHMTGKKISDTYPWAKEFTDPLVHRIVEVEQRRGELTTPLTPVAKEIHRFEGAKYFCNLLVALGKENFFRGYEYSGDTTKKAVLSRLLKRCYPAKDGSAAENRGMIAVLPVYSQARGRIFLPFADDDPKTAEIMSKILLLSDDKKIKDPSILRQITG